MALSSHLPGYCHQTVAGEGDPRRPAPPCEDPGPRVLGGAYATPHPIPAPLSTLPAAAAQRAPGGGVNPYLAGRGGAERGGERPHHLKVTK